MNSNYIDKINSDKINSDKNDRNDKNNTDNINSNELMWEIIDKYFKDNPNYLVQHHLSSYNDFIEKGIPQIIKEKNPIKIMKIQNDKGEYNLNADIYIGGKSGNKLYYGKPIIYDDEYDKEGVIGGKVSHFMYPNEARLRNMNYSFSIHFDVDIEFNILTQPDGEGKVNMIKETITLEKILLGRFPVMLRSNLCVLNGLPKEARFNMGECRNDPGGYFIIDGKEKSIICQEKFADNMIYIRANNKEDTYSHSAEIRSISEDASKPVRTLSVKIVAPTAELTNNNIVVNIPNVRKPIPLFIVFRALGIISDKDIIKHCLLDIDKNESLLELFIPSIHDAGTIFTQETALKYIATFTKYKSLHHIMYLLSDYFFAHIGELNFTEKAYFLGYMVKKMLMVYIKSESPTDRDSFNFKRIELPGTLLFDLFNEYYSIQQKHIYQTIDKEYTYHQSSYNDERFIDLITNNYPAYFRERHTETGVKKAFKGNWGSAAHTKKIGVVQDLNRLSFNSALSQLRKCNLPLDSSAKVVGPRLLHSSQWGLIDPVDTPDGGNVGLHKHMAIATNVTSGYPRESIINFLYSNPINMISLEQSSPEHINNCTKIFVNGYWCGIIDNPEAVYNLMKFYRRIGMIPMFTSISWNIRENIIFIYTDSGRLTRPILYVDNVYNGAKDADILREISYKNKVINRQLFETKNYSWEQLVSGFMPKKSGADFDIMNQRVYKSLEELYNIGANINQDKGKDKSKDKSKDGKLGVTITAETLNRTKAIVEFMDTAEAETAYISTSNTIDFSKTRHTHAEIHSSLMLGVMGNQIIFPANNQLPRDLFSCGQSKQAVSLYHSNYQNRIDKLGVVLNYGQLPLIKSKYTKYINGEEHPYGLNVVVAIMCYSGYNVEDAIIFNAASVARGMFNTTYFNMYEKREESSKVANTMVNKTFKNIENANVVGLKPGYDYSELNEYGMIRENTKLDDKKIIIGMTASDPETPGKYIDNSVGVKKGQLGYVDKAFMTEGEEGFRLAKVRIREERIPAIGDKFCSRCGQKGTCGILLPESDMPFTEEGIRPDIIINPHALPSRMTIGQLVESLTGKVNLGVGAAGDCTAFENVGQKTEAYGDLLNELGYHSSGNELLYNGMTGEQLETEIFIGPTYYMRLKHMVKDKVNYRARGPRTALTRQTVGGRANDGGLRIGEMERDGVIGNGMTKFLNESMLIRGDEYYIAVCNKTGLLAICNENKNLFLSPHVDGPIKFNENMEGELNLERISRFGRSFSLLRVPYSLKLLIQELATMNIQLRIITNENIDQFDNMNYSNNINKIVKEVSDNVDLIEKRPEYQLETLINQIIGYTRKKAQTYSQGERIDMADIGNQEVLQATTQPTPSTPEGIPPPLPSTPEGPPPSPNFEPTTPEGMPPPPTPELKPEIPLTDEQMSLQEGDKVALNEDTKSGRVWELVGIDGDDVVITTDDFEVGEPDTTRIARLSDLTKIEDDYGSDYGSDYGNENSPIYRPFNNNNEYDEDSPPYRPSYNENDTSDSEEDEDEDDEDKPKPKITISEENANITNSIQDIKNVGVPTLSTVMNNNGDKYPEKEEENSNESERKEIKVVG